MTRSYEHESSVPQKRCVSNVGLLEPFRCQIINLKIAGPGSVKDKLNKGLKRAVQSRAWTNIVCPV